MPIHLLCGCGKQLNLKEELSGKKIKCPGCQTVLTVPRLAMEEPAVQVVKPGVVKAPSPTPADEEFKEQVTRKKAKLKKALRAKQSNALWWLVAAIGLMVCLLFCCGVGYGGYYLWWGSSPGRAIVGKWRLDVAETRRANPNLPVGGEQGFLEFQSSGKFTISIANVAVSGDWRLVSETDTQATVELQYASKVVGPQGNVVLTISVYDRNRLVIVDNMPGSRPSYWARE